MGCVHISSLLYENTVYKAVKHVHLLRLYLRNIVLIQRSLLTPSLHHQHFYLLDALAKIEELSNVVKEHEIKHQHLEAESESRGNAIAKLKSQLKKNERNFKEELKKKDQQVLTLKVELDAKSGNIAYLTTEMHKYKVLQHGPNSELAQLPQSPPTTDTRSRKRSPRVSSATDITSRPVTAKGTMPLPEAEVFLARAIQVEPESDKLSVKPTPPVLPPISGGDDIHKKVLNRRQQLIRRRVDVNTQPEYSKLAVGKVASSSNTWVHEPNAATK